MKTAYIIMAAVLIAGIIAASVAADTAADADPPAVLSKRALDFCRHTLKLSECEVIEIGRAYGLGFYEECEVTAHDLSIMAVCNAV